MHHNTLYIWWYAGIVVVILRDRILQCDAARFMCMRLYRDCMYNAIQKGKIKQDLTYVDNHETPPIGSTFPSCVTAQIVQYMLLYMSN